MPGLDDEALVFGLAAIDQQAHKQGRELGDLRKYRQQLRRTELLVMDDLCSCARCLAPRAMTSQLC